MTAPRRPSIADAVAGWLVQRGDLVFPGGERAGRYGGHLVRGHGAQGPVSVRRRGLQVQGQRDRRLTAHGQSLRPQPGHGRITEPPRRGQVTFRARAGQRSIGECREDGLAVKASIRSRGSRTG